MIYLFIKLVSSYFYSPKEPINVICQFLSFFFCELNKHYVFLNFFFKYYSFSVSLTAFNAATLFYWTSPSIPVILESDVYNTNLNEASYLAVIPAVALVVGSPFYALLMDKFGRKPLILSMGILHLAGWLLVIFSDSMLLLYLSRCIYGFGDACLFAIVPIYIGEISTPKVRSSYGNIMMIMIYGAQFSINAVGYYFDLRTTAFIFIGLPVIFLIMFGLMPETPYFYLMKGKEEASLNSLIKLRQASNVTTEFLQIKQDVERQLSETGRWIDLIKNSTNRKAMLVCTVVRFMQQFSGISAFALYTQYIFGEAVGSLDRGQSAMIYSGMLAFTNLLGSVVIDLLGRRKAITLSCTGCTFALIGEAVYFYFQNTGDYNLTSFTWVPLVGMCLYVIFFSTGLSIVPTIILGELFSASIKSKASCVMNIAFALLIGLSTQCFQILTTNFGLYVPFAFFGVCTFVGIFTSWFIVPETKGKTLEEIQQGLSK